ncbi:TetR family transcriptional regulator [Mycobacterium sp. 852013-50091_SCH5140682]|uniref:TetR/AcrR family transcriptional regulator n=1 Tax=Mycobacterium sp. 852013-50091_SCH5140682 TaxID=1834109 RepID=UPI0007EABCD2|nr:TetR/AcrR family transcriptional regulator [Mycobacterium sp. 852013-50091_SCH5140682]OBC12630.1 TetR family transcriptional regulator [Mycobacterium sp. 852013-50091_SCH5140682]
MQVRERLIAATAELMERHGVAGTGIAGIVETSGVTRRSIYVNFPGGKAELVAAATRSAGDELGALLRDHLLEPNPVGAFSKIWAEYLVESNFEGGCPIVAAASGRDEASEAADAAAAVFDQWTQLIAARLSLDGIKPDVAQSLSTTIVAAIEGAVVLSRAARSTTALEQVAHHLDELVAAHRPAPRSARRSR